LSDPAGGQYRIEHVAAETAVALTIPYFSVALEPLFSPFANLA
jgi:hypothetical protein